MRGIKLALIGLISVATGTAALAETRVALVIGNSSYVNAPKLANPANDATAVSLMLEHAGFSVVEVRTDLGNVEMRRVIRDFSVRTQKADVALVYYAGHGMEMNGQNYLVPIDAKLQRDIDVEDETISVDRVVGMIEPARQLRLLILDACRDNPLARSMVRTRTPTRASAVGGFAQPVSEASGTLIAFAARAGSTASDGAGTNSPFTAALLKHLMTPDLDIRLSLGKVRDEVMQITSNVQEPFVYGSLGGDKVVLARGTPDGGSPAAAPVPVVAAPAPATAPASIDPNVWRDYELAARLNTIPVWDEFLKTHSTGFVSHLARGQRAKLLEAPPPAPAAAAPVVAAVPPEAATRALPKPEPSSRERRKEPKKARTAKASAEGGSGNSASNSNEESGCARAKRTLKAAMAMGFDNRDGVITAVRAKCGR